MLKTAKPLPTLATEAGTCNNGRIVYRIMVLQHVGDRRSLHTRIIGWLTSAKSELVLSVSERCII